MSADETRRRDLDAALGDSVLAYLESLPPKQQLLTLLILKGPKGFPVEQLLAAEDDPKALLSAAAELAQEGKLVRREHSDGRVFWAYSASAPGERPETHPRP